MVWETGGQTSGGGGGGGGGTDVLVKTASTVNGGPNGIGHNVDTLMAGGLGLTVASGQKVLFTGVVCLSGSGVDQDISVRIKDDLGNIYPGGYSTQANAPASGDAIAIPITVLAVSIPPGMRTFEITASAATDGSASGFNSSLVAALVND